MGQPTDTDPNALTNGAESVYTGHGYDPDAVLAYLVNQGVPIEQAKVLSQTLRRGAPDDLGIQGSAAAQVADREVGRLKSIHRYLDLEKRAVAGDKLPPTDQAFVSAVRNRHRELIQQRAIMAMADQQNNQRAQAQLGAGERSKMAALEGQQLEQTGGREQERLANMQSYSMNPQGRAMTPDGMHSSFVPEDKVQGGPMPGLGPEIQRRLFGQAKTAAAIAQQFGLPPDAAAQLAADLHTLPTPQESQPQQGQPAQPTGRAGIGALTNPFSGSTPAGY